MPPRQDLISARQLLTLSLFALFSTLTQGIAAAAADIPGGGGLLSPLVALLPLLGLLFLLAVVYKRYPDQPLDQIVLHALGPVIGRVILFLFLSWAFLSAALTARLYSERIVNTMFSDVPQPFFLILLFVITGYAARRRLNVLSRAGLVFLCFLFLVVLLLCIVSLSNMKAGRLVPLLPSEFLPFGRAALTGAGLFGVALLPSFLSARVRDRENTGKKNWSTLAVAGGFTLLILIIIFGLLGSGLTGVVQNPYIDAVRNISGKHGNLHLEALVIALSFLPDFLQVTLMVMVINTLFGALFRLPDTNRFSTPIHLLLFAATMALSQDLFDLYAFARTAWPMGSLILMFGLLTLTLLIALLRVPKKKMGFEQMGQTGS